MNINSILKMRINYRTINKMYMQIPHISAAIYPRFHTHSLSKFLLRLKSRKSYIIVLFDMQII